MIMTTSSSAKALFQMSRPWRSTRSLTKKSTIRPPRRGLWVSGRKTKHTFSSMACSRTWSKTTSVWKSSTSKTGKRSRRWFQPRILASASKDGCSSRNSEATRPNGFTKKIKCWRGLSISMGQRTGLKLQSDCKRQYSSSFRLSNRIRETIITSCSEMANSAEKDGWLLWILPSKRRNGT